MERQTMAWGVHRSDRGGRQAWDEPDAVPLCELVAAARAGEGRAWAALHARFSPLLRAVARRHRLDAVDIDEVVQLTWVKCFEHLDRLREPGALSGWLVTTCRREALGMLRGRWRCVPVAEEVFPRLAAGDEPAVSRDPLDAVLELEAGVILREAVAALPARQRLLVTALLQEDGGQGYGELAESLSMPVGSIGPTRLRAVQRLRRDLSTLVA
jgi:RNA polymerase sigma factor (sigma-70 family)